MMERMRKFSTSSMRASPTAAAASASNTTGNAMYANGRSLLNDALSPSGRQILHDFLDDDSDDSDRNNASHVTRHSLATPRQSHPQQPRHVAASTRYSLASLDSTSMRLATRNAQAFSESLPLPNNTTTTSNNSNFVQIQCPTRPFCLQLAEQRGAIIVAGFVPDQRANKPRGVIECSGLVHIHDVLVAVNGDVDGLTDVASTVDALTHASLPATLTFRRVAVTKARLGDYTTADIARNLSLRGSALLATRTLDTAALLVQALVDVLDVRDAVTPLGTFIARVEALLTVSDAASASDCDAQLARIQQLVQATHRVLATHERAARKRYTAAKPSQAKRIAVMSDQRLRIDKKLDAMRVNPSLLTTDNPTMWQAFVELRQLSHELRDSVEAAKRSHFLPAIDRYALRSGSDGVYVGIGDVWIQSFDATFTLETHATAPHVRLRLSNSTTNRQSGLKLRLHNFTLCTENRLPSFHCDELTIDATLVADVPLEYDPIDGWRVPLDTLHVELQRLKYYERHATSTKRGQHHDTIVKMLVNRLLPSLVRDAAQNLLCNEIGPLLVNRNAHVELTGGLKIKGTRLALYDAPLCPVRSTNNGAKRAAKEQEAAGDARELLGLNDDAGDDATAALHAIFRSLTDAAAAASKKHVFAFATPSSLTAEPLQLSIRSLQNYLTPFDASPALRALILELWDVALSLQQRRVRPAQTPTQLTFHALADRLVALRAYPVDVSVTLLDLTFRLELCEGAATYYTCKQRIVRQAMDSVSVGLAHLDALRDGTFWQHQLTALDAQYEQLNKLLAYVTANVDDCSAVVRAAMRSGFCRNVEIEATDVACKGPCSGTWTIPLTDVGQLLQPRGRSVVADPVAGGTALTHDDGALVFSKFFFPPMSSLSSSSPNNDDDVTSMSSESDKDTTTAASGAVADGGRQQLPSDRMDVRVKNASVCVLLELPTAAETTATPTSFVPLSFALVTDERDNGDDGDALPPRLRVETGAFAKCQYKAERVAASGTMWQLLQRSKQSTHRVLASDCDDQRSDNDKDNEDSDDDAYSVWDDYAESPFFQLDCSVFTSCQVTREHMFWSLKSASPTDARVARIKHRVCLVELLLDVKTLGRSDAESSAANDGTEQDDATTRRAERQRRRHCAAVAAKLELARRESLSLSSAVSHSDTYSRRSSFAESTVFDDDDDRLSASMRSIDSDDNDNDGERSYAECSTVEDALRFSSVQLMEAFEEENSGDEDDSDSDDDDEALSDGTTGRVPQACVTPRSAGSIRKSHGYVALTDDDDEKRTSDNSEAAAVAAQNTWGQQFEREVRDLSVASDTPLPSKSAQSSAGGGKTSTTLHKQTSVFF